MFFQNTNTLTLDSLDLHAAANVAQIAESRMQKREAVTPPVGKGDNWREYGGKELSEYGATTKEVIAKVLYTYVHTQFS